MSSLSPNYGRTRRTSRTGRRRKSSSRSRKTQSLSPTYNDGLHKLCKKDFFSMSKEEFIAYRTTILKKFEKKEFVVNNTNKNGETPLDLLCKQYNHHNNREEVMGSDDRQTLLSLIQDLQMHGAELKKCSL